MINISVQKSVGNIYQSPIDEKSSYLLSDDYEYYATKPAPECHTYSNCFLPGIFKRITA